MSPTTTAAPALPSGRRRDVVLQDETLLMATLYLTQLPWVAGGTNPLVDIHWINAILLCTVALTLAGDTWGVGRIWARVVGNSWLR